MKRNGLNVHCTINMVQYQYGSLDGGNVLLQVIPNTIHNIVEMYYCDWHEVLNRLHH